MAKATKKRTRRPEKVVAAKKAAKKASSKTVATKSGKKSVRKVAPVKAAKKAVRRRKSARKAVKKAAPKAVSYPAVLDPTLVGNYPASAAAGGGYVWDAVLEYRVWCHPERGAPDLADGNDYYYPFESYQAAWAFSQETDGAEEPLALILQEEYIDEPEPGHYVHVRERRNAEWSVNFLSRPRRTPRTIPDFLAPDAPLNRLDIIRGSAKRASGEGGADA